MRARAAMGLALLLGLAGCPRPAERPYPSPSADELMAALRARQEALKTLRASVKLDHIAKGGARERLKVTMLLGRGGRLRFEADSPLGGSLATLTSDGERFAFLDLQNNRFLVGPAKACNVARMIGLVLPPGEIVDLLMGGAPLDGTPTAVRWEGEGGGRELLTLALPGGATQLIRLDGQRRRWDVLGVERRDAGGKLLWRIRNEDFGDYGAFRLPRLEDITQPASGADAELRFRSLEPNAPLDDSLFRLPPPEGLSQEEVDC